MVKLTTTEANIQKLLSCQYDDNVVSMTIFFIDYQVVIMDFLTTGVLNYCTADYLATTPKISQCDYFIVFSDRIRTFFPGSCPDVLSRSILLYSSHL